jgi:glutamate synthase (NADPH/NADH) small chain
MRKVAKNWLINTKEFISNDKGELVGLKTVEVENDSGQRPELVEKEGSEKTWPCDLALLAWFYRTRKKSSHQLGLELDMRTN